MIFYLNHGQQTSGTDRVLIKLSSEFRQGFNLKRIIYCQEAEVGRENISSVAVIININKMSIYSGFATRQQQQSYDSLVLDLISVLQRRIIKFYVGEEADQGKFHNILFNLHHHLARMEECKYLEPRISPSFRELLTLTANVQVTEQQQPNPQPQSQARPPQSQQQSRSRQVSVPKESLNFSTDKISQDMKAHNIGRIRHQSPGKEDGISSRGDTNPQNLFEKQILRSSSSHHPKEVPSQLPKDPKQLQKWGCIFDSDPPALPPQEDKKNIQYIIREYVNKGQRRRNRKRTGAD